jgi:hypothetical protein
VQALGRDRRRPRRLVDVEDGERAGPGAGIRALVARQAAGDQNLAGVASRAARVGAAAAAGVGRGAGALSGERTAGAPVSRIAAVAATSEAACVMAP